MRWLTFLVLCLALLGSAWAAEDEAVGAVAPPAAESADLGTLADEISDEAAGRLILQMVNAARRTAGVGEVQWSEQAALLAQAQANAMAEGHFGAHYDERGWRPELRWNEMGETDFVAENVVYYEIKGRAYRTPELLWQVVSDWINSPDHFAALTDPQHTHMGFGVSIVRSLGRTYVAAAQEFVTDLGQFELLPEEAAAGATLDLSGTLMDGVELAYLGLGREPLPAPMTPAELNATGSPYPLPEVEYSVPEEAIELGDDGQAVTASVALPADWTDSAVHVTAWVQIEGWDYPVCAMDQVVLVR